MILNLMCEKHPDCSDLKIKLQMILLKKYTFFKMLSDETKNIFWFGHIQATLTTLKCLSVLLVAVVTMEHTS